MCWLVGCVPYIVAAACMPPPAQLGWLGEGGGKVGRSQSLSQAGRAAGEEVTFAGTGKEESEERRRACYRMPFSGRSGHVAPELSPG